MPNTLAHIGIQGLATRAAIPGADPKWIFLGCIVPDIPWILQRIAKIPLPDGFAYDLRLYAIVQSSLLMCLVLAAAAATLCAQPRRAFAIMALGSLLHLLLDALQTKWANGVHLFAPISWELLNFGVFWPEDIPTYVLTALGLGFFVHAWRIRPSGADLRLPKGRWLAAGLCLVFVYVLAPFALLKGPEAADNHSVRTLRDVAARPGLSVEFDRPAYWQEQGGTVLRTLAGERLKIVGADLEGSGHVSIRGRFLDQRTVFVEDLHLHDVLARDLATILGLALVLAYWIRCVWLAAAPRHR